jgi:NAD(P)-dependent dehydrogenase (short-subunit alcohol dehydrogenase family)
MTRVALIGGSGGIGHAMVGVLSDLPTVSSIQATYFRSPASSSLGNISSFGSDTVVSWSQLDATDATQVSQWMESIGQVDWLINCAGYLHDPDNNPEKTITQFDAAHFDRSMHINCLPTLLLARHAKRALEESTDPVFATISARVGSISDNRLGGWYSYRASKAALNMVLKTLSIEYRRTAPKVKVLALHPGTTDTALSKPFQANVATGKLFSAQKTAGLLVEQVRQAKEHESGRFIAYDGSDIPW